MRGSHSVDIVDVLHLAIDDNIRIVENGFALAIEDVGHYYGIRYAGFVFDAQEQESFGGAGTLPADDTPGDANRAPVAHIFQLSRWCDAERVHILAMKCHGMFSDGEVGAAEVRVQALARIHRRKGIGGWGLAKRGPVGRMANSESHNAARRCVGEAVMKLSAPISLSLRSSSLRSSGTRSTRSWMLAKGDCARVARIARAACSRSPFTEFSPRRTRRSPFSSSIVQSQSERVTSMGLKCRPCRWASLTKVAGA